VLVEGSKDKGTGWVKWFSDNYVPVRIPDGESSLSNRIVPVAADRRVREKVVGKVLTDG
jgi:hypothetical protein